MEENKEPIQLEIEDSPDTTAEYRDMDDLLVFFGLYDDEEINNLFILMWYRDVLKQYESKYAELHTRIIEVNKMLTKTLLQMNENRYSEFWDKENNNIYGFMEEYYYELHGFTSPPTKLITIGVCYTSAA
jgi:hypothetical protein